MSIRLVIRERSLRELHALAFDRPGVEGAAFLLCGEARAPDTVKLIVHAVVPIADEDYLRREFDGLSISSQALARVSKLARHERLSVVFAHSHPQGVPHFSLQDDREEAKLIPFLQARLPDRMHGTVVVTTDSICARIYAPNQVSADVLVVGDGLRLHSTLEKLPIPDVFDRQVRAFGQEGQSLLSSLHVGVVGLGGTGSPVAEELYRLGVGRLTLIDGDTLDVTNVNRVFGSRVQDAGEMKVAITKRHLDAIGLTTHVHAVPAHISYEWAARELVPCDLVFGCTDKQIPRAILTSLVLRYLTPVFDLGVLIESRDGVLRGVHGRVTTLLAGEACLFCRGRISAEGLRVESLSEVERQQQVAEGYAPELEGVAPAVIAFTAATASFAVSEMLNRVTGFMGAERRSTELLIAFDQSTLRTNRVPSRDDCACSDEGTWARGDEDPFLGMMWPKDTTGSRPSPR